MHTIYLVSNLLNGKVYVGQTSLKVQQRWNQHIKHSRQKDTHFCNAIRKHKPENFKIRVLNVVESQPEADSLERHYIHIFDSTRREIGYNHTFGGASGSKPSEATRQKMRLAKLGKKQSPEHVKNRRFPMSDETRNKISQSMRGIKRSPDYYRKMVETRKLNKGLEKQNG